MSNARVITDVTVTYHPFPDGTRAALLTLDHPGSERRPNAIAPETLDALEAAIAEATSAGVAAILVTGRPGSFAAGSDLGSGGSFDRGLSGSEVSDGGRRVFCMLMDSQIPTFACINGVAIGGGLELALHCHYRAISADAGLITMPELTLGLVPGWGGSYLVPRLIGPRNAVHMILENPLAQNAPIGPAEAVALGIGDVLLPAEGFVDACIEWAFAVVSGGETVPRTDHLADAGAWEEAAAWGHELIAQHPEHTSQAPARILALLSAARTSTRAEAYAAENRAIDDLLDTPEAQAALARFRRR